MSRLQPVPWHANYIHLRALAAQLRASAEHRLSGNTDLRIIDVGCGDKPYAPIFAQYAREYIGVDYRPGPTVDVVGVAESLPFEADEFDALVCSQVLEHVADPDAVLHEAWRVLRPGGVAFVSTHGVANYHPNPEDYWRWTHAGLAKLLRATGTWDSIDVTPNGGTATALTYLVGRQAEIVASKSRTGAAAAPLIFVMNVAGWNLDRLYLRHFRDRPPDLACNYLAVAVKA